MKYFIFLSLFLLGCASDPLEIKRSNNNQIKVEYLFEIDGIKVYRFTDDFRYHYFTSKGETIVTQKEYHFNGKTSYVTHYDENIN